MRRLTTAAFLTILILANSSFGAQVDDLIALAEREIDRATEVIPTGRAYDRGYGLKRGETRYFSVDLGYAADEVRYTTEEGTRSFRGEFTIAYLGAGIGYDDPNSFSVSIRALPTGCSGEDERFNAVLDETVEQQVLVLRKANGKLVADLEQYAPGTWESHARPSSKEIGIPLDPFQQIRLGTIFRSILVKAAPTLQKPPARSE